MGLYVSIIDITQEVEQKQALEMKIKMKDDFLSFITHEFKTPLTVIYSAVQAINHLHKNELSQKSINYINKIHQNALRQLRLVNNFLDITRSEAGYLKVYKKNHDIVKMSRAIVDSVALYAQEKNIRLLFKSDFKSKYIALDDEKYERILLNLLSNAIKFTPKDKSILVHVKAAGSKVCIEVKDEGLGIPKEKQSIIFDRFGQVDNKLTREQEGTGIGLYLAKLFTNALGGSICVESTEGHGTTFQILLEDSITYDTHDECAAGLHDNRLIQITALEFSDIYSV